MAFLSFLAEAKSLAYTIHKFQCSTSNKKASRIDFVLQRLVDRIAITELLNFPLLDTLKKKIRVAASASSCFYDPSWLINTDKCPVAVAHFDKIITNFQVLDSFFQQSITSVVTSAVATAIAAIQTKYENEMLSL